MRVKEYHRIEVAGELVNHELEPVYYRVVKNDLRLKGVWYCEECRSILDVRRLIESEPERKRYLDWRGTSVFKKLKSSASISKEVFMPKSEPGLSREDAGATDNEKKGQSGGVGGVAIGAGSESVDKLGSRDSDRYPGTARSALCPCGSGEKYKHCCGKGAPPKLS